MLELIIRGKWKSPSHSKDRRKDDSHEIKKQILKELNKHLFSRRVGKNPDIDIDPKTKKIVLKGTGEFKGKEFPSNIDADQYFTLCFISESNLNRNFMRSLSHKIDFDSYYVVPADEDVLSALLDFIFDSDEGKKILIGIATKQDSVSHRCVSGLSTHGGRTKGFDWQLVDDDIFIKNEDGRVHLYSLSEAFQIIQWLNSKFGSGWFPLANNVALLGKGEEKDGLGAAILNHSPKDITHAQGSSYLGVVLEKIGVFQWNDQKRGIEWRIVKMPQSVYQLKQLIEFYFGY